LKPKLYEKRIWRSDPIEHKRGITYEDIRHRNQIFVIKERHLGRDTCRGNCEDYKTVYYYGFTRDGGYKNQQTCEGTLRNCFRVLATLNPLLSFNFCLADPDSDRRYNQLTFKDRFFRWHNSFTYGLVNETCSDWIQTYGRLYYGSQCDVCACYCHEDDLLKNTNHEFFLYTYSANISDNYVISGVRFEKIDKRFHLRAEQSKLLPGGKLNRNTSDWIPIPSIDKGTVLVMPGSTYRILSDSFFVDQYGNELVALTSIGLQAFNDTLVPVFGYSEFNFLMGIVSKSFKYGYDIHYCSNCTEYFYKNQYLPTNTYDNHIRYESHFIEFGTSNYLADIGQSTLPFFDIQPVQSDSVLSGGGFRIRRKEGNGGFITPVLISLDFYKFIEIQK